MPVVDPRIDAYIANSAGFAQPILQHLRAVVHQACPEVEEAIKWSMPFFLYRGMLCNMASFKAHCAFGFWKGELLLAHTDNKGREAMGQFGRITAVADLPPADVLEGYIKQAMALNADGAKAQTRPKVARTTELPADLLAALADDGAAAAHFEAFPPSARREYGDWLIDAKTEATRLRRLAQAIEWIAEGKPRNWKYKK
ncbi:YdeI/OmpD-associated family protein [Duganella sp. FT27W]|uniref:YdeI/OmpD-associated family protein n=1 Tax=Duganella sp. FT27W TaxID=2654636 RepID=UPI00128C9BAF|nr:YdeI/OmpD-associated family protein [Duganella sp. FT27W]MPQ56554.1 hypothetical protein [Duganella sp. FT27W]